MSTTTEIKSNAYDDHLISGKAKTQRQTYLQLVLRAALEGLESPRGTLRDLTDKEAALRLGVDRTSVNGRRNELCGGYGSTDEIQERPLVVPSCQRSCTVTGNTAMAWTVADQVLA